MRRVFTSRRCLSHAPAGMPEAPARLEAVLDGVRRSGWETKQVEGHPGAEAAVLRLHSADYVERLRAAIERGDGLIDSADNPLMAGTWASAWAAVEVTLAAADWVAEAPGHKALAAVRPPGHHAESDRAMGFCYFANVAIAADTLLGVHGFDRVAVFDFDVHHGNGTQHLFESRADVFFASVHQYPFYPGTGGDDERGVGAGLGSTLNLPLPAGTQDADLRMAVSDSVLPALRAFAPQVLLVSAGFDGWEGDPLGGWAVTATTFGWLGEVLAEFSDAVCDGRLVTAIEGGYSLEGLSSLTDLYLRGVAGEPV